MIAALAFISPSPIGALAPVTNPCPLTEAGVYICDPTSSGSNTGRSPITGSTASSGSQSTSDVKYVPYRAISVDPNGDPCIDTRYVPAGTPTRPSFGLPDTEQTPGSVSSLYDTAPPCPPRNSAAPEPTETPFSIALGHWARIPLPRPEPRIEPGRAITGKTAYLQTGGRTSHAYTSNTVFGVLAIQAIGTHHVDWGDGERTGPHTTGGGPWPSGEITHNYQDVGSYNVVVTTRWTATWRLGANSGTLPPNETSGRLANFPVQQIQAVVGR